MSSHITILFKEPKRETKDRHYCCGMLSASVVVINYYMILYSSLLGNL